MKPSLLDRQLCEHLAGFDCISFDVFDTAVVRLVGEPCDVFGFVAAELRHRQPSLSTFDFAPARIAAERRARERAWAAGARAEVTLAEIYDALPLPADWNRAALLALEVDVETRLCRPYQPMLALYREALRQSKRVIFLSDMYLPGAAIGDILSRCGYDGPHRLFVSSEADGRTKALGDLYPFVLEELGLAPSAVLHIGDNHRADFLMAMRHGIATHHIERVTRRTFGPRTVASERSCQALQRGLLARRLYAHETPADDAANADGFWYRLGYEVAGPLLLGFVRWIVDQLADLGCQHVYFMARDGYIVEQAYRRLMASGLAGPPSGYLYASRRAFNLPAIESLNEAALRFLCSGRGGVLSVRHYLERAGLDADAQRAALNAAGLTAEQRPHTREDFERLRALFRRLEPQLRAVIAHERPLLLRYFAQEGLLEPRAAALVDVGWHGSLQVAIDRLLRPLAPPGHALHGLYLGTFGQARPARDRGLSLRGYLLDMGVPAQNEDLLRRCVELFEFFHVAPHGSTTDFEERDGRVMPRLADDETLPEQHVAAEMVQRAALDFIDEFLAVGASFPWLTLARETAMAPVERLLLRPTRDEARRIGELTHADGYGSAVVHWPLARPPGVARLLREPGSLWREYNLSFWREGYTVRLIGSNERLRRLRASLWQAASSVSKLKRRLVENSEP
jgi:predicted HAD superfamily hydrolase